MFNNVKRSSNLSEVKKFNTNFHNISTKMEMSLDEEIMEMIIKNGAHIKFITDSPIEWRLYKNVPIGVIKSISRLPIIPGNTLVVTAKNNFKLKIQKLDVSFLIINTINKGAPLYSYGKNLGKKLKEYFPKNTVKYYEITNKEDFIRIMNENLSTFFVYYGHGSMPEVSRNRAVQVGKLHIGSDELDMIELYERVKAIPTVTILGACQTQVLNSHYLNIGNMFLGLGSQSVLATYFPVDGLHTFSLIESIFRHLKNFFEGDVPDYIKKWSDIVLQARRTHYITEPSKSIVAYLDSKGDKNKIDILDLRKSVMEYCIINSYKANGTQLSSIEQAAIYRDEAYRKYFEKYSEKTREIVDYFFEQNYVFPESMLFTSLGSPEKIEFI